MKELEEYIKDVVSPELADSAFISKSEAIRALSLLRDDILKSQTPQPKDELKEEFEKFRTEYRKAAGEHGRVRGLETEWTAFKKKFKKEVDSIVPLLIPALNNQIESRKAAKLKGEFVPYFKNFSTWLNQREWEAYEKREEPKKPSFTM